MLKGHMDMNSRRKILYGITGAGITTSLAIKWVKPVVNSVLLPAHADTSISTTPPPSLNTPPSGENIIVDMQFAYAVNYDMSEHLSDAESPTSELAIAIVSLPDIGTLNLILASTFNYELLSNPTNVRSVSFTYFVLDPQGAKSDTYTVDIINLPQPLPV